MRTRVAPTARSIARSLAVLAAVSLLAPGAAPAAEAQPPARVTLKPDERAGWSPSQIFGALRPDYHGERTLAIETSPPGATLDLFYVRASFQKRYEQARAPVIVDLPSRSEAGKRDSVTIRAFLPGHKIETVHVPVKGDQEKLLIELDPLENELRGVAHTYFAGRAGLSLLLKEPPSVRLQKAERGFSLILAETASDPGAEAVLAGLRTPYIVAAEAQQLGEDLLVRVELAEPLNGDALELRALESSDPIRNLHVYTLTMAPPGGENGEVARARAALDRLTSADVVGCAERFDATLRSRLDREQLARALAPRGRFTDRYLRAALRRLGEVSPGGVIALDDGSRLRPDVPLELSAAAIQAAGARGYLALLHAWVRRLEPEPHRTEALRSLVAPEMDPAAFADALAAAEAAERACRGASVRDGSASPRS